MGVKPHVPRLVTASPAGEWVGVIGKDRRENTNSNFSREERDKRRLVSRTAARHEKSDIETERRGKESIWVGRCHVPDGNHHHISKACCLIRRILALLPRDFAPQRAWCCHVLNYIAMRRKELPTIGTIQ